MAIESGLVKHPTDILYKIMGLMQHRKPLLGEKDKSLVESAIDALKVKTSLVRRTVEVVWISRVEL